MHATRITAVALLAGLAACAAGPNYHPPKPELPAALRSNACRVTGDSCGAGRPGHRHLVAGAGRC